jgi:DNA-binding transcriptional MocR family regulator
MKQFDFQKAVMASNLDSTCKWLFVVIGSHVKWPSGEAAFPSIATLAKESGLSKATIHRAKLRLIEQGYLVSNRRFNKSNTYTVHIPTVSERDMGSLTVTPGSLNMRLGSLNMRGSMSQN